jgi:hypothetical protein
MMFQQRILEILKVQVSYLLYLTLARLKKYPTNISMTHGISIAIGKPKIPAAMATMFFTTKTAKF